jgi:hypothetical protein
MIALNAGEEGGTDEFLALNLSMPKNIYLYYWVDLLFSGPCALSPLLRSADVHSCLVELLAQASAGDPACIFDVVAGADYVQPTISATSVPCNTVHQVICVDEWNREVYHWRFH